MIVQIGPDDRPRARVQNIRELVEMILEMGGETTVREAMRSREAERQHRSFREETLRQYGTARYLTPAAATKKGRV